MKLQPSCPTCAELNIERSLLGEPLYVCDKYLSRVIALRMRGTDNPHPIDDWSDIGVLPCGQLKSVQVRSIANRIYDLQQVRAALKLVSQHTPPIDKLRRNIRVKIYNEGIIGTGTLVTFSDHINIGTSSVSFTLNLSWFLAARRRKLVYTKSGEYVLGLNNGVIYSIGKDRRLKKTLFSDI